MKIMHIITGLGRGGAERQLTALVRGSDPAAVSHSVVSLMDEGVYGAPLREAGAQVHCLKMDRHRPSLASLWTLAGMMRAYAPDVVQTWLYHADLAGVLAGGLAGRPPVLWSLRCSDMRLEGRTRPLVRGLALLSRFPAAVVANSAAGIAAHHNLGYRPRRWRLIANGIDTGTFRPDPVARDRMRAAWGVAPAVPLVGCIARHDPMKNYAGLLAAFAAIPGPAKLVVAGAGTEPGCPVFDAELAASGLDPTRLVRLGERGDVADVLAALDLFVLGSAFGEGFPNAVAEAMACGIPVVATDTGDCRAIIGACGRVVPPGQTAALTRAMTELLATGLVALGEQARQRVAANWSVAAMVEAYHSLYSEFEGR